MKRIVKEAQGVPRKLNILCDNALITGFGYKRNPVNAKIVNEVITDFHGEEEPPPLNWMIASAALAFFIGGPFLISPYRSVVSSRMENVIFPHENLSTPKMENRDLFQTAVKNPVKEETKPWVDKPEISPASRFPAHEEDEDSTSSPVVRTLRKRNNLFSRTLWEE